MFGRVDLFLVGKGRFLRPDRSLGGILQTCPETSRGRWCEWVESRNLRSFRVCFVTYGGRLEGMTHGPYRLSYPTSGRSPTFRVFFSVSLLRSHLVPSRMSSPPGRGATCPPDLRERYPLCTLSSRFGVRPRPG